MVTMRNLLVKIKFALPHHERLSWSHGEISHGHHEISLGLTVRFLMVTMRNLLVKENLLNTPPRQGLVVSW